MNIQNDFEEFLQLLNAQSVECIIVGGYAVAFHGYARATDDLDLFFRNTPENIKNIRQALQHFGLSTTEQQAAEFADSGNIIRMGIAPLRIELMNSISGLAFEDAWEHRISGTYGETPVAYISLPDLLQNKRASARPKDLADVDELGGNRDS